MSHCLSGTDVVTNFLRHALATSPLPVCKVEALARAAGLLGGDAALTHRKLFKNAKKVLGIRSVRNGFGADGRWWWSMPPSSAPAPEGHLLTEVPATYVPRPHAPEPSSALEPVDALQPVRADGKIQLGGRVPAQWIDGIARLDHLSAPKDVPVHRWRLFLHDCNCFLLARENGAGRATELGWNAEALFAFRFSNPLAHLRSAGLTPMRWAPRCRGE